MENLFQELQQSELERFFAGISLTVNSTVSGVVSSSELHRFFNDIWQQVEKADEQQRAEDLTRATRFNVFDLIEPDENKLSDVIADLLDPKGTHGQGDAFLRLFIEQLGIRPEANATRNATVRREALTHFIPNDRRRIDVLIEAGQLFLAIENKVDSLEQTDQVKDYLEHLDECSRGGPVPSILIYLTPNGRRPKSLDADNLKRHHDGNRLNCMSYHGAFRDWLKRCVEECKAPKVCHFLSDFIAHIETTLKRELADSDEGEVHDE